MTDARLLSLSKRINAALDRVDEERAHVADIYAEAKSAGYIPKILRKAITRQRMDASKRQEEDSILDLYDHALGNVGRALEAISKGATWEEAGKAHGVPRASLARAAAVSKRREMIPDHDPDTGVIESSGQSDRGLDGDGTAASRPLDTIIASHETTACGGHKVRSGETEAQGEAAPVTQSDAAARAEYRAAARKAASSPVPPDDIDLTIPPFLRRERAA